MAAWKLFRRERKCLHHYLYLIDEEFGFMHVRIQGWIPYECQIYINGRQWLARQLDRRGIGHVRWDNSLLAGEVGDAIAQRTTLFGMDAKTIRAMLLRNLGRAVDDRVGSHDMYDDDAVLEFPQSGEQFEGVANIREWRSQYPGSVTYDIRRIRGADDIWLAEMTVSYDNGKPRYGVDVLEITNGKILRETVYVGEPFDAPEWRAQWRVS